MLFVGESPPAGKTFFYWGNSKLFNCTQKAFQIVYGSSCGNGDDFLKFFRTLGCFLDDLCAEPVNRLEASVKKQKRMEGICSLRSRLALMDPAAIVVVMKDIQKPVQQAMELVHINYQPYVLPFPAY